MDMISYFHDLKSRPKSDLLVLPFYQKNKKPVACYVYKEFNEEILPPLEAGDFLAKEGETVLLYHKNPKGKEKRILLLGLGDKEKLESEAIRRAYSAAVKAALKLKCKQATFLLPSKDSSSVIATCEGVFLANYAFDALKRAKIKEDPTPLLTHICFIGEKKESEALVKKTLKIVQGVNFARDLMMGNADDVTPQYLAETAKKLSKQFSKVKTVVYGKKEIEKMKMGLLLAVNQGSSLEPTFTVIEYHGNRGSKEKTAIVGKGITFDTGGLNLKPGNGMLDMKMDMTGAAVVLATIYVAAMLDLKVNLVGVIPSTENVIGSKSYKPWDVYFSYLGKSVEIANTDAEGRLILADALGYVVKNVKPKRVIDLATLTGAIIIVLGEQVAGLFSNNDKLSKELLEAGEVTGERLYRLPIYKEYKEELKSDVADLKNCGDRKASSSVAALFLQEFVDDLPWAHLDIAGTASRKPKHYDPVVATGMGVRLLIQFLENLS